MPGRRWWWEGGDGGERRWAVDNDTSRNQCVGPQDKTERASTCWDLNSESQLPWLRPPHQCTTLASPYADAISWRAFARPSLILADSTFPCAFPTLRALITLHIFSYTSPNFHRPIVLGTADAPRSPPSIYCEPCADPLHGVGPGHTPFPADQRAFEPIIAFQRPQSTSRASAC